MSGYICTLVGWLVLGPSYFSQDVVLFFLSAMFGDFWQKMIKIPQPTHGQLSISHARSARPWVHQVDPTSDPSSELVIYAVSGPGKQPSRAASGSKPTTGAVDLSTGAATREDALSAAGACCCQCCCCCAAASTTTALAVLRLVTFRTGMIILELATNASIFYLSIYLCSLRPRQAV